MGVEVGEPVEKCKRTWAWKAWVDVWVPVQPLSCGTRGRRHTNDSVMRPESSELFGDLITILSSPVATLLGNVVGQRAGGVSAHGVYIVT